jgi:hypothetical protein
LLDDLRFSFSAVFPLDLFLSPLLRSLTVSTELLALHSLLFPAT